MRNSLLISVVMLIAAVAVASERPVLRIDAPPSLSRYATKIRAYDDAAFDAPLRLTGLSTPGDPIDVILATEGSEIGMNAPKNVSGWAFGERGVIVLLPSRAPSYPFDGFEELLMHEIAHVYIDRAARGNEIPRWFHEGLAMLASGKWTLEDRGRLAFELIASGRSSLGQINASFGAGEVGAARAYSFSAAFMRDLVARHGSDMPARVLHRVADGLPFEAAFYRTTGETLAGAERSFWDRQTVWSRWVPFATSTVALWSLVGLLAILAILYRRKRDAAIRARWDEAETAMMAGIDDIDDDDDDDDDEIVN